jgi:hypothetical protein
MKFMDCKASWPSIGLVTQQGWTGHSIQQRRTLLTVIAALCSKARIDYSARGAAQHIKRATELIGTPIDDGTIDSILKEIPDAVESRTK